jgi:FKBP-type peptidyl-prolyl cis-trans isomerase 2
MTLTAQANGQKVPVRIVEVKKDVVVMNFNHPLAGKTLHFDVEVLEIK